MKIVLGIETGGPGGAENMLLLLAQSLRERGDEVIVAAMRTGWFTERVEAAGLPLWVVPQKQGIDWRWVFRFARRLRLERVDVLHGHLFGMNIYGATAARLAGIRAVSTVHGQDWLTEGWARPLAYRILLRLGVPIVPVSHDLATFLAARFGVRRERLHVIHNGIAVSAASDPETKHATRRELGLPTDGPLLLAVGSLYPVKDHATLIRAVAPLPEVRLAIAGRGQEEAPLRQLAKDLDVADRVLLLGLRDDVDDLLRAADLFVQPSLSEGLPLAVLEAMAAGLPVVATRVGGMPEAIVEGETGTLVEPANPAALAAAIRTTLDDPAAAARLGAAGRTRVAETFSIEAMTERYHALYSGPGISALEAR